MVFSRICVIRMLNPFRIVKAGTGRPMRDFACTLPFRRIKSLLMQSSLIFRFIDGTEVRRLSDLPQNCFVGGSAVNDESLAIGLRPA